MNENEAKTQDAPSADSPAPVVIPADASIPRPLPMIQKDYTEAAAQLGHMAFQIEVLKQNRDALLQKLNALTIEGQKATPPADAKP